MNSIKTIALVAALAAAGCSKKKDEPAPQPLPAAGSAVTGSAAAPVTGSAATGSAAPATETAAAVDVPTEMDFEDHAKDKITDKNVEAEVKSLEDDLGK